MSREAHAYNVCYDPRALKELGKLDRQVARRIVRAINALSDDPRPSGVRALVGFENLWRIRIGDYRVIYSIKDTDLVVLVLRVAHRSTVYRKR